MSLAEAADDDMSGFALPVSVGTQAPMSAGSVRGGPGGKSLGTKGVAKTAAPAVSASVSVATVAQSRVEHTGCPHCGGRRLQRWGNSSGLPRYRCGGCQRTFNALTGTPLARLRKKERWADLAQALMSGESLIKAAERCGVAYTTAFRWRHRFLSAPALDKPSQPIGIVETGETFILKSWLSCR